MKVFLIALASLALSACSTTQMLQGAPVIGNVCAAADRVLVDEKTYATALTIYNPIAYAYLEADRRGELSAGLKLQLKPMVQELYKYVGAIKAAKGAVNCDLASMRDLKNRITDILPKGN